jgi:hypothetical protein
MSRDCKFGEFRILKGKWYMSETTKRILIQRGIDWTKGGLPIVEGRFGQEIRLDNGVTLVHDTTVTNSHANPDSRQATYDNLIKAWQGASDDTHLTIVNRQHPAFKGQDRYIPGRGPTR